MRGEHAVFFENQSLQRGSNSMLFYRKPLAHRPVAKNTLRPEMVPLHFVVGWIYVVLVIIFNATINVRDVQFPVGEHDKF